MLVCGDLLNRFKDVVRIKAGKIVMPAYQNTIDYVTQKIAKHAASENPLDVVAHQEPIQSAPSESTSLTDPTAVNEISRTNDNDVVHSDNNHSNQNPEEERSLTSLTPEQVKAYLDEIRLQIPKFKDHSLDDSSFKIFIDEAIQNGVPFDKIKMLLWTKGIIVENNTQNS